MFQLWQALAKLLVKKQLLWQTLAILLAERHLLGHLLRQELVAAAKNLTEILQGLPA